MQRNILSPLVATLLIILQSCTDKDSASSDEIVRFDLAVPQLDVADSASVSSFITDYSAGVTALRDIYSISAGMYESPGSFLVDYAGSLPVEVFTADVAKRLPDLKAEEMLITKMRRNLANELPEAQLPEYIYGVVLPFNQSIILIDSVGVVVTNHYLGADYPGYEGMEVYRRRLKTPDRIPYDLLEATLLTTYPYAPSADSDNALSRMLYEGAAIYAMTRLASDKTPQAALGYDDNQMKWVKTNEANIWQAIVGRDYLFATDPAIVSRLVNPSPATQIIHADAPGRVGRYVGYRIVDSYVKNHPDATLETLLSPQFYTSPTVLEEAAYRPK